MTRFLLFSPLLALFLSLPVHAQVSPWAQLFSSAYFDQQGYEVLRTMTDAAGPRVMGTAGNEKAIAILADALRGLGYEPKIERFSTTGWIRGDDEVRVVTPFARRLRCAALGFTDSVPTFAAGLVDLGHGYDDEYEGRAVRGSVVLVSQDKVPNREELLRYEAIDIAASHGARAILFINEKAGGQVLAGAGNFHGHPTAIPAFSITKEEGLWLRRLLTSGTSVTMDIRARSHCVSTQAPNLVATLPGRSPKKIVVGAHVDTWDIGLGGVDNGQGTAVLFELARLLRRWSPNNAYTIEFVWFNGEELGLHGAKAYAAAHHEDPILAVINMDMTGSPLGINAMGFDEFVPFFRNLVSRLNGFELPNGVSSTPWTNSDHVPFIMKGIPTFTVHGKLDEPMYTYYHDFGDSFDKISKRYISDAAAILSILTQELANAPIEQFRRRTREEVISLWKKNKLDERLKKQKEWDLD